MSKTSVEDLIDSASNRKNPVYLRKDWIIQARIKLRRLNNYLNLVEDGIIFEVDRGKK